MIADAPLAAGSKFSAIAEQVAAYLATVKIAAVGGLTWTEFGELAVGLLRLAVTTLDGLTGLTGAEKREIAVEAVAALFDQFADRCVPLVAWPVWLLAKPAIRSLVLAIAAGAVEQLLPLVRAS